jgi:hypothetical protein
MRSKHTRVAAVIVIVIFISAFLFLMVSLIVSQPKSYKKSDREIALEKGEIYAGFLKDWPCNCVAKKIRDITGTDMQEITVLATPYSVLSALASKSDSVKEGDSVCLVLAEYIKQGVDAGSGKVVINKDGLSQSAWLVRKK